MTSPAPKKTKRRRRELILIAILLLFIPVIGYLESEILHFGNLPFSNTVLIFVFINVNILLLLFLIFLFLRNITKLIYDRKRKVIGSKLRTKLVTAFVGMALLPTILLFFVSMQVITSSIEFWFNIPVEQSLKNSLDVGRQLFRQVSANNHFFAKKMAKDLCANNYLKTKDTGSLNKYLEEARSAYNLQALEIYSARSERLALVHDPALSPEWFEKITTDLIQQQFKKGIATSITSKIPAGELVKTLLSIPPSEEGGESAGVVAISSLITGELTERLSSIALGYEEYQQLKMLRQPIRFSHFVILAIVALLVIFAASWFGFYLARPITTPIQALAEGTHRVADGDLDFTIEKISDDEVGMLVSAFNKMTHDLKISKARLDRSSEELRCANREAEQKRRYMEIVLEHISAGVISRNADGLITTINRSAENMLGIKSEDIMHKDYTHILNKELLSLAKDIRSSLETAPGNAIERSLRVNLNNKIRTIMVHASVLKDESNRDMGVVVVFDDLTELERAQRMAAWREVARRIAHEVKNPLTPIKLSAQRIQKKYRGQIQADVAVFDECVHTIVSQVDQIRNLVNEFSTFARMPNVDPRPNSLPEIIHEAIALYREGVGHIRFEEQIGSDIPALNVDKEQMKRVLINLFDNAIAAIQGKGHIRVVASFDPILKTVRMEVADNGCGISPEDKLKLFEPYFSTKKSGMGLGLAIVNSIITDHKGFVRVRDNHPTGTIFVIELPV
jgi:two-component system nitrogen regulation sensor histidine kinase NtrY